MEIMLLRLLTTATLLLCAGCSQRAMRQARWTLDCTMAESRLSETWNALLEARADPKGCRLASGVDRCEMLRGEIDRLAQVCPHSEPALLAGAALAYDERQTVKAQQLLDQILSAPGPHPKAAALRARIAMEEGNLPYALRFAEQRIRLAPDDAGLREVFASALFLSGRYGDASKELSVAERLGAPGWRVAYHRGLIAEAEGLRSEAVAAYREAMRLKPGWRPADSRLKGLEAAAP